MNNLRCPQCGLSHIKRNGYTHYGKQNYWCKDCDRQFVEDSQRIGEELKDLIKVLLLERLSLRGICRVTGVSLTWLLHCDLSVRRSPLSYRPPKAHHRSP
jgi:transposase-like protein